MEPTPPPIPIYVGGLSDVALRRAARNDGWIGDLITTDRAIASVDKLRAMRAEKGLTMRRFHGLDAADRRVRPSALRAGRGRRHHRHHHHAVDVPLRAAGFAGREDRRDEAVSQGLGARLGALAPHPPSPLTHRVERRAPPPVKTSRKNRSTTARRVRRRSRSARARGLMLREVRERHLTGRDEGGRRVTSPVNRRTPATSSIRPAHQNGHAPIGTAGPVSAPEVVAVPTGHANSFWVA